MSGIVGLLNADGAPVDCALLCRMTRFLAVRGPDAQNARQFGQVGLGHTLLDVAEETASTQPISLDGRRWIVADARIDARPDLIDSLGAHGAGDLPHQATDAELILKAYEVWGEDCVAHLQGDFAFGLWDAPRRRLFCARDHLGVKPLFYADVGSTVIFSNMLDCVRLHPSVPHELHDAAIADFLLFGLNLDPAATAFRAIRRLPPAHAITWENGNTSVRRYWRLPIDEPVHFARSDDYSERFGELLRAALRDRLRSNHIGVLMSGGLDSTTLAAATQSVLRERRSDYSLQAITSVYDRLVPDRERHYAKLAADHLRIPIRFDVRDDEVSILQWDQVSIHTPEPVDNPPACAAARTFFRSVGADRRVLLYGEGPDNALRYEWRPYLAHLLARCEIGRVMRAAAADLTWHRRVPLWSSMRGLVQRRRIEREPYPEWLAGDFEARESCRDRWEANHRARPMLHPVRPKAYDGMDNPRWQQLFDNCDLHAGWSGMEILHPFLDLRVLQFMLSVPAIPWCRDKLLIRRSMRTALPREVLRRKKTALPANPDFERVRTAGLPRLDPRPDLERYVAAAKVPRAPRTAPELRSALRAHGLSHWLRHLDISSGGEHR